MHNDKTIKRLSLLFIYAVFRLRIVLSRTGEPSSEVKCLEAFMTPFSTAYFPISALISGEYTKESLQNSHNSASPSLFSFSGSGRNSSCFRFFNEV